MTEGNRYVLHGGKGGAVKQGEGSFRTEADARKDRCEKEDTLVTQNLPPDSGIEHLLWGSCSIAPRKGREEEALM